MKYLTTLFLVFFILQNSFAAPDSDSRSEYSIMVSYIMPRGAFAEGYMPGTYPQLGEALTQSLQGDVGGVGARKGYGLDFSGYYYMNNHPSPTVGGIKVTFLQFSTVPFRWYTPGDHVYNTAHYSDLRFLSFNVGPVIKMELGDYAAMRIYTQLCGAIGWNGSWSNGINYTYVDVGSNEYFVRQDASLKFKAGSAFKSESGISINGSSFIASLGFSYGRITFNQMEYHTNSVTETYKYDVPSGSYQYVKTTQDKLDLNIAPAVPTSYLFFSAGYLF